MSEMRDDVLDKGTAALSTGSDVATPDSATVTLPGDLATSSIISTPRNIPTTFKSDQTTRRELFTTRRSVRTTRRRTRTTHRSTAFTTPTSTTMEASGHDRLCEPSMQSYCHNGGVCYIVNSLGRKRCACLANSFGRRCMETPLDFGSLLPAKEVKFRDRTLTITGLAVGAFILGVVCVVSYILAKNRREMMQSRKAEKIRNKKNNNGDTLQLLTETPQCPKTVTTGTQCTHVAPQYPSNGCVPVSDDSYYPASQPFNSSVPLENYRSRLPAVSKTPDFGGRNHLAQWQGEVCHDDQCSGSEAERQTADDTYSQDITSDSCSPTSSSDPSSSDQEGHILRAQLAKPRVHPTPPVQRREQIEMNSDLHQKPFAGYAVDIPDFDDQGFPIDSDPEATVV